MSSLSDPTVIDLFRAYYYYYFNDFTCVNFCDSTSRMEFHGSFESRSKQPKTAIIIMRKHEIILKPCVVKFDFSVGAQFEMHELSVKYKESYHQPQFDSK